jgi:undecaprenyl diphosphate synthase
MFFFRKKKDLHLTELDMNNIPVHVALIMDGNGRWAKNRHLPISLGHNEGVNRVEDCIEYGKKVGIKYLSFYAFSTENWKRDKDEVDHLISLLFKFYEKKMQKMIDNDVCIRIIGSKDNLPQELVELFDKMEAKTKHCKSIYMNLAFNYGGRLELIDAVNQARKDGHEEITEELIENYLYTHGQPDVDLMIRTSGEMRISNFMIWQNSYSEFVFRDCYWPDFNDNEFSLALLEYQNRSRRFGGR